MADLIYFYRARLRKLFVSRGVRWNFREWMISCKAFHAVYLVLGGLFEFRYIEGYLNLDINILTGISYFKFVLGEHDNLQSKLGNNLK